MPLVGWEIKGGCFRGSGQIKGTSKRSAIGSHSHHNSGDRMSS